MHLASEGVYSTEHGSPFMGKYFRCREDTDGQRSFKAEIVKKVGLLL